MNYDHQDIKELHALGANFIICTQQKTPAKGEKAFFTRERHSADHVIQKIGKGLLAFVPRSLDLMLIDIDEGDPAPISELLKNNDIPHILHATRRGHHIWVKVLPRNSINPRKWSNQHAKGDIRHTRGYAIIWDMPKLFEAVELEAHDAEEVISIIEDTYQVGERNMSLFKDAAAATRKGHGLDELKSKAKRSGLPDYEIDRTVKSAQEAVAKEHQEKGYIKTYPARDEAALADALALLGYSCRYNTRAKVIEFWTKETSWRQADDLWLSNLVATLAARFRFLRPSGNDVPLRFRVHTLLEFLDGIVYENQVDPFLAWLKSMPQWDQTPRLEKLLHHAFAAADDQLSKWASRYLLLGSVQRARDPGCVLDEIPVLTGPQGIGKSKLLRNIFPRPVQGQWFSDSLELGVDPRRQLESFEGSVLTEIAEMNGLSKYNIERMKTFLTRQDDNGVRGAYKRSTEQRPRNCIFVGTSNEKTPLPNDPSGNRRFVVVPLSMGRNVEEWLREPIGEHPRIAHLWAEAIAMYEAGETANLPINLRETARERAEGHRWRDDTVEDGIADLELKPWKFKEILAELGFEKTSRAQEARVKNALSQAGWSYALKRDKSGKPVRRWHPPERQIGLAL